MKVMMLARLDNEYDVGHYERLEWPWLNELKKEARFV